MSDYENLSDKITSLEKDLITRLDDLETLICRIFGYEFIQCAKSTHFDTWEVRRKLDATTRMSLCDRCGNLNYSSPGRILVKKEPEG